MNRIFKQITMGFFFMVMVFTLTACGGNPPDDIVKELITRYSGDKWSNVDSYTITNSYTKIIGTEEAHVYDWEGALTIKPEYVVTIRNLGAYFPVIIRNGTVAMTKRGNAWYPVDAIEGVVNEEKTKIAIAEYNRKQPVVKEEVKDYSEGIIDANVPIFTTRKVSANKTVSIVNTNNAIVVALDGVPIFTGADSQYHQVLHAFSSKQTPERVFFLMTSVGGRGVSCEAQYFFMWVSDNGVPNWTPMFGACSPMLKYSFDGTTIKIETHDDTGTLHATFSNGKLLEENTPVVFKAGGINDPSK